jgi:hypothetical protein
MVTLPRVQNFGRVFYFMGEKEKEKRRKRLENQIEFYRTQIQPPIAGTPGRTGKPGGGAR